MSAARHQSAILLWGIGLGSPLVFYALVRLLPSLLTADTRGVVVRELVLILVSAGWLIWVARRSPLSATALGLMRPKLGDLGWGVVGALTVLVLSVAVAVGLKTVGVSVRSQSAIGSLAARPSWLIIVIALTAAISEETVFRATMIPAIRSASGSAWVAVVVSAACFALPHFSVYGAAKVLVALVPGLVLAGLFLWRRSLMVCIVAHFLVDIVGLAGLLIRDHSPA